MKRLIFLLLFALSFAGAMAQNESQWGSLGLNAQGGIIRAWNNQYCIAYAKVGGTGRFFVLDEYGLVQYADIDASLRINDFRIVDDYVVFCGSKNDSGLYGSFIAAELLLAGNNFNFNYCTTSAVSRYIGIEGLQLFRPLVLIGILDQDIPINEHLSYVAHHSKISIIKNWEQTTVTIFNLHQGSIPFLVSEITRTNNYYAVVGWSGSGLGVVRLDVWDPENNNSIYDYTISDVCSQYHCTAMDNDRIAVAAMEINGVPYTSIRTIDLQTMVMDNAQIFPIEEKAEPAGLAYIPADKSVVMLQQMRMSCAGGVVSASVYINPNTHSVYYPPVLYRDGYMPQSIDMFRQKYFVEAGGDQWFMKDKMLPLVNHCYDFCEIKIVPDVVVPYVNLGCVQFVFNIVDSNPCPLQVVSVNYVDYCTTPVH